MSFLTSADFNNVGNLLKVMLLIHLVFIKHKCEHGRRSCHKIFVFSV